MYENMMEELKNLAQQVDALEIESKEAVANLEMEVQKSFADKEKRIAEFVGQMVDVVKMANIPIGKQIQLDCCGDHWEGKPGSCDSHCRSIGLCICRQYDGRANAWFGRRFIGSGCIDKIICVKQEGFAAPPSLSDYGWCVMETLRENILSRWNERTEDAIAKLVFAKCKAELEKRTQNATEKLKAANERYAQFCKGE